MSNLKILKPEFEVHYITEVGSSINGKISDVPDNAFGAFIDIYLPYTTKDNNNNNNNTKDNNNFVLGEHHMLMIGKKISVKQALNITKNDDAKRRLAYLDKRVNDVMEVIYPNMFSNDDIAISNDFYPFYTNYIACDSKQMFNEQLEMSFRRYKELLETIDGIYEEKNK